MKNNIKKTLGLILFTLVPVFGLFAQPSPPTNNVVATQGEKLICTYVPGPIGNGVWILLFFALVYAAYQVYQYRKLQKTT